MLRFCLLLFFVFLIAPFATGAQSFPGGAPFTISVYPEYPRPYEEVTVTIESTLFTISTSDVTISLNGAVVEEGSRSTVVKMGGPGTKSVIRASVTSIEGTYSAERVIGPAQVALIVEPDSTAHPFYEGARLVPSEGRVRIVAVADIRTSTGSKVPVNQIAYEWKLGSQILLDESGTGRNVLVATAPPRYRDAVVSVTAQTKDQSVVAYASTVISPLDPLVRIYPKSPLRGISFANAIAESFAVSGTEASFHAVPYFFANPPSIAWSINTNTTDTDADLTVRSGGGSGTAALKVSAEDAAASVSDSATLMFSAARSTNVFGF